ncbi:MAG TPA: hypothetical protein VFF69_16065 [Phycisphaerales bacterium]|nr:hypothetical protein [Phycisphaerales bacterium]
MLISALAALLTALPAFAQPTAFTYQGRLTSGGAPASGLHDFRFKLFDAATGGGQVGATLCANNISVENGLFTTALDFGQQFVTPSGRFLEIFVRADNGSPCTDDFGYVLLTPRQPLTAAPLANHAKSAFALDAADGSPANALFVDNAGNVGIGTSGPGAKLDVRGPLSVSNTGDGADLLWLNSERSWVFRQDGAGATTNLKLENVGGGGNKSFFFETDGVVGIRSTTGRELYVPGGVEDLRIVRGAIGADGVLYGTGFTATRLSLGRYLVTFTTPFADTPTVTATVREIAGLGTQGVIVEAGGPTLTQVVFRINDHLTHDREDADVQFIAIGPR